VILQILSISCPVCLGWRSGSVERAGFPFREREIIY
jgi:hypothetical protein